MKSTCPKCGGDAYIEKCNDRWMIRCCKCNYKTMLCSTKEKAKEEWLKKEKTHDISRNQNRI